MAPSSVHRRTKLVWMASILIPIAICGLGLTAWHSLSRARKLVHQSKLFDAAVKQASSSPVTHEILGSPTHPYPIQSDNESRNGVIIQDGEWVIPLVGPKGEGRVHACGVYKDGKWHITSLVLIPLNSNPPVNLQLKP